MRPQRRSGRLHAALAGGALFFCVLMVNAAFPAPANAGIPIVSDVLGSAAGDFLKDALKFLFGDLAAKLTSGLMKFLVHIDLPTGGDLSAVTGPLIVIGGFFLVVGLITSVGDGYREVIAGTDTPPRVIGQAVFRVIGLALLMGSWFWLVPLVVDVANHLSSYVLSDHAVTTALRRSLEAGVVEMKFPLLALLIEIGLMMVMIILVVLKFILGMMLACLYVGGPAIIGLGALPRIGPALVGTAMRFLFTVMIIPLAWAVVFATWAAVNAGTLHAALKGDLLKTLMGPGFFFAGVVVLLGVTRRLFTMATGGLKLTVPGAGLARAAIAIGIGRAIGGAMGGAGGKTPAPAAAPSGGAPGSPAHVQSEAARGINPVGATPATPYRKLPQGTTDARAQERATQEVRRGEMDRAHGDFNNDGGARRRSHVPEAALKDMRANVDETAAGYGGYAPVERLNTVANDVPRGDRAGITKMAGQARQQYPDDSTMANQVFRRDLTQQYAGRDMLPQERQAIVTAGAGGVDNVIEAWGPELQYFDQSALSVNAPAASTAPLNIGDIDPKVLDIDSRAKMVEEHNRLVREQKGNQQS